MSTDALRGSPFPDYRVPGLVLLLVNGVGSIAAGVLALRRPRLGPRVGLAFGGVLIAWIAIQVAIIGLIHWLQPAYLGLGTLECVLALALLPVPTRPEDPAARARRPAALRLVLVLLGFLGLTALGGGIEMLVYPHGSPYVPAAWLDGLPLVDSWRVPGLILGGGLGLGSLLVGYGLLRRPRWRWLDGLERRTRHHGSWLGTMLLGAGLVAWIGVELVLIPERSAIEALYAAIGVALVLLPWAPSVRQHLEPRRS